MRNNASLFVGTILIAWMIAGCGEVKSVAAYLWSQLSEYYHIAQLEDLEEASIPQVQVEYAGEIGLELKRTVELIFDENTPGIGRVNWIGITPDSSLLLTDGTAQQAHEFNLRDGSYIRPFGRKGRGPGEYTYAENMTVDPKGQIYLFDGHQVLRYDRQGHYLDMAEFIGGSRVLAGRDGELFFLGVNMGNIMELQRRDPVTWEMVYRIPLSTERQSFVSRRMRGIAQVCYSTALHRLYYLGPNDYMVKEIDATTGEITRQFGRRPKEFVPLPESYHDIGRGSFEDMQQLQISTIGSMTLLKDQYLVISYDYPTW